jgi:hypothetical protein
MNRADRWFWRLIIIACASSWQCNNQHNQQQSGLPAGQAGLAEISLPSNVEDVSSVDTLTSDITILDAPTKIDIFFFETENFAVEELLQSEIVENEIDVSDVGEKYINECPKGDECYSAFFQAVCLKSNEPEIDGYKSICTALCKVDENGAEKVIVLFGDYQGDCDSTLSNGATCCGLTKNPANSEFDHYCLPAVDEACCYNSVFCIDQCCPDGIVQCSECGCLADGEVCCGDESCAEDNICDMCGCHLPEEDCCPGGVICPSGFDCAAVGAEACVAEGSINCGNHYCPAGFNCISGGDLCCPAGQEICDEKCCGIEQICHQEKNICVKKPKCVGDEIACQYTCCQKEEKCAPSEDACEAKCQPPAPYYCENECCMNNYSCECESNGGLCLPEGGELCNCKDKTWCEPLQECIQNSGCHKTGKICKPLGAEDCPEAEGCFCNPGYICTYESPACCASDEPVACGDYCCPDKNECLTDINDCLSPGWDYCEKWGTKCGVGLDCKELELGCKNDNEEECSYGGVICGATDDCVGEGKGVGGCCPTNNPIACDGYCCPTGTHCEIGCGGCVVDGYKCCGDGQTECLNEEICWKGGAPCLASGSQDCGSYWCAPEYVCSVGPQQCCPAQAPQTCGSVCCKLTDSCVNGVCVPLGGEYCAGAPNSYCGSGYLCGKDWTQSCCCGNQCMQPGSVCCDANSGLECVVGTECCQVANTAQGTLSACVEQGGSCCLSQNGSNVSVQICGAVEECCSIPGYMGTKITHCKPAGGVCFFAPGSWTLCSCPKDFKQCGWHCIGAYDSCCGFNTKYYCPAPNKCKKIFGYPVCMNNDDIVGEVEKTENLLGIDCK